jgi:hypothetical protein
MITKSDMKIFVNMFDTLYNDNRNDLETLSRVLKEFMVYAKLCNPRFNENLFVQALEEKQVIL